MLDEVLGTVDELVAGSRCLVVHFINNVRVSNGNRGDQIA